MKLAIIVPCRDRLASVSRCLNSIARAAETATRKCDASMTVRVLLVNDGSHCEFAPALAREYPSVTIIDVDGSGPGAARNTGLKTVDADLYLLTDSDCVVGEDWCLRAVEWYGRRRAAMGQGVPWLHQRVQNPRLGACEEALYRHMFSSYIDRGRISMIDPRCLMIASEYFASYPRDLFASWLAEASVEDRAVIGGLIERGLEIDWCPDVLVYHEDPPDEETYWRQKYRHGGGRIHVWRKVPAAEFLLNRYFLAPTAAGCDPRYVVPAHIAFLLGYRDACRRGNSGAVPEWWTDLVDVLDGSVHDASHWLARVEAALCGVQAPVDQRQHRAPVRGAEQAALSEEVSWTGRT